jgi:hypothetical protein
MLLVKLVPVQQYWFLILLAQAHPLLIALHKIMYLFSRPVLDLMEGV